MISKNYDNYTHVRARARTHTHIYTIACTHTIIQNIINRCISQISQIFTYLHILSYFLTYNFTKIYVYYNNQA
jgi:hypothetical protein